MVMGTIKEPVLSENAACVSKFFASRKYAQESGLKKRDTSCKAIIQRPKRGTRAAAHTQPGTSKAADFLTIPAFENDGIKQHEAYGLEIP